MIGKIVKESQSINPPKQRDQVIVSLFRFLLKITESTTFTKQKWEHEVGITAKRYGENINLDNWRRSAEEFKYLSQPYTRKAGQKEAGTGLGLNICIAILEEHNFEIECDKIPHGGTQMKITMYND